MRVRSKFKRALVYTLALALAVTMTPATAFGAANDNVPNYPEEDQLEYTPLLSEDEDANDLTDESESSDNQIEDSVLDEGVEEPVIEDDSAEAQEENLIMPFAAIDLPDDDKYDMVSKYEYDENASDLHDYKYFKIYEYDTLAILGEGTIGGSAEYSKPMIPDGR